MTSDAANLRPDELESNNREMLVSKERILLGVSGSRIGFDPAGVADNTRPGTEGE